MNVDIFGLKIGDDDQVDGSPGHSSFHSTCRMTCLKLTWSIQNKNIGHSLIPEVRDLYEAWVQFTVNDSTVQRSMTADF